MAKPDDTDEEKNVLFGGMTDEQRADMTDEELAGIDGEELEDEEADEEEGENSEANEGDDAEDDDSEEAGETESEEAGEDAGDEGDGEGDDDGEGEDGAGDGDDAGTDTTGETTGDDDGDTEGDEEDEDDPLDVTRSVMPTEWQLPKDAQDKLKGLNDQAADLADKFDSGDLTAREYHTQREALDEQRATLRTQINDAQKAWQKGLSDWSNRTVKAFLRDHKEYSADNPTMNRMLDAEVRALQLATNDPFNPRILRQAHANIQKAMGKAPAAPAAEKPGKPSKAASKKDKAPVLPGKKKPAVPPTLARVPQDQIEDANGGKYARLDRLSARDPHAFEETMLRMSAKDRAAYEEYLAGGV
ncbi:hypothetical protein [Bradyrhizobium sp. SZCCHNS1012]|uniref:hypothetical protein n=1 Tax=Bradyrhizobium sp. SZCCHNS1012 TaxID=3057297 RepID=UPI002916A30D|nr:hypothetical protein [Bradyrhizobium sp. SZCCHNS1012]